MDNVPEWAVNELIRMEEEEEIIEDDSEDDLFLDEDEY